MITCIIRNGTGYSWEDMVMLYMVNGHLLKSLWFIWTEAVS